MVDPVICTPYFVLRTGYVLLLAVLAVAGCGRPSTRPSADRELSFSEQVDAVRKGATDRIQVEAAPLNDDDLSRLFMLDSLRELLVDHADSQFSTTGLPHIGLLPNLEHLRIRGAGIDNRGLIIISRCESLKILNLPRGTFNDEALPWLKKLPHLELFRFGSPNVTDAGMKALAEFPALKRLHLIGVPITDAGLMELAKIEQLESLYVDDAPISDAAWEELFRQRPKLHVHVNQEHHDRDPHKHPH